MATLRHLLVCSGCALAVVATAAIAQRPNNDSACVPTRGPAGSQTRQVVLLGFDYQLAGHSEALLVQAPAAVAATIPEPPFGASVAGAALIGLVLWTRRYRA